MDNQIPVQTDQPWKPAANPWLIAAGVMLATFMEVLDTSVANVSLTHIAGSLSVSNDEATWVLTSYLVSNAVILPTSSWFSRRFGRRRFLITCITIFTLASLLCGLATSLGFLILARIELSRVPEEALCNRSPKQSCWKLSLPRNGEP